MSPISTNPALVPPGGLTGASAPSAPSAPGGPKAPTSPERARRAGEQGGAGAGAATGTGAHGGRSFAEELASADRSAGVQFSKHALARVERRGIELSPSTLGRLSQGVQRAASKGSRDSLVLVDGTAFVVSVNNRTVVTAVGSEHMKDNVFTNIDSAVIA
ncbi:MAG TPA: TIGR02530 family flagellar biosynthesis protein [Solirubrobacteraceae bacterium]|nr:TIGR02530 family flagellar biosynthesis protein [Solirubrobacteraceae bacterium]